MFARNLFDVKEKAKLPPVERVERIGREYRCAPAPPEVEPPLGQNLLMHLLLNPSHAKSRRVLFHRLPKRLQES